VKWRASVKVVARMPGRVRARIEEEMDRRRRLWGGEVSTKVIRVEMRTKLMARIADAISPRKRRGMFDWGVRTKPLPKMKVRMFYLRSVEDAE
jgi:hypothetical protein